MYHIVKAGMFLWKWLYCSWIHRKHRCHPCVNIPKGEPGSNYWHCAECHTCGEAFDLLSGEIQEYNGEGYDIRPLNWRQKVISRRWNRRLAKENK